MLKKQQGISIIEVLIALVITTIIVSAIVGLLANSIDTSRQLTTTAKLDQALNNTLETIARDIQRAGYNTNATTSATNLFFATSPIKDDVTVNTNSDCITFSYQVDATTTPTTGVNRFGFRLSNNAIQYRTTAAGAGPCNAGSGWENLTDPNIVTISAFTITLNTTNIAPSTGATTSTAPFTSYRSVTISITGHLVSNSSVTRTITRTIKIFNNKYTP